MFSDLLLPTVITAILIFLMSASFMANDLITFSRNKFVSVMAAQHVSDTALIIDPGHGGADGGAVSVTGGKESVLNLQIGKKSELIAAFFGIDTILTRDSEEIYYPETTETIHDKKVFDTNSRVELINNTSNAVLISIHQNYFDNSSVSGAQIFYRDVADSLGLAEFISSNLNLITSKVRAPQQISDSIYIFKKISCPAILIECGFISNPSENTLLNSNTYQNKIAIAVITGYLQYENRLTQTVGGTYES